MKWNDMKWNVMICGDLMGFDGIWWGLMASSIVLLHVSRKNNRICQKNVRWVDLEGCHFIVSKKLPSVRGSNSIGACSPTGSHKAKACKGTVAAASAACDMWWYGMKWYVMICGDLMGFDGIWRDLMASYIVLLHASKKYVKQMSSFGWTLRAAIL